MQVGCTTHLGDLDRETGGEDYPATRAAAFPGNRRTLREHEDVTTRRPPTPRSRSRAAGNGASPRTSTGGRSSATSRGSATGRTRSTRRTGSRSTGTRSTPPAVPPRPRGKPTGSAARKAAAARRAPVTAERPDEPRQITVRGLVLFVVVLMAFIVLAPTLRAYVSQQEQTRSLGARIAATEERTAMLQGEIEKWDDPAFVQARARERLGYVMPGETPYRVVDPQSVTGEEGPDEEGEDGPVSVPQDGPWYLTVWDSVQVAGEAGE